MRYLGGVQGLVVLIATAATASADDPVASVTINGNGDDLGATPIIAELGAVQLNPGPYQLRSQDDQTRPPIPAQVVDNGDRRTLSTILETIGASDQLHFTLEPMPKDRDQAQGVSIVPLEGGNLEVRIDGEPFTTYRANDGPKPYFYPVIGPSGDPVTRSYPMEDVDGEDRDHPHQRSFWFTHGDVNGSDFWGADPLNPPNPRSGTIEPEGKPEVIEGPVVGLIRTRDRWLDHDGAVLCDDLREWTTYATSEVRIIDLEVRIMASHGPVTFGETKEGMFGLRLASSMNVRNPDGGRIINAEGVTDTDAWGKASPWVDYNGPVDGETLGVAIMNHPSSFRYPTTWHVRDYGLFAANPFGYKDFGIEAEGAYTIPAGESIAFRYRVLIHRGGTEEAAIPSAFRAFVEPPRVVIETAGIGQD